MTATVDFVEAHNEPRHLTALQTPYLRMLRVRFPCGDTTLYHRHQLDSFYIDLANARLRNDMVGEGVSEHQASFGTVSYKAHSEAPYIHRISCLEGEQWFCVDGELLQTPPCTSKSGPLQVVGLKLELESRRVRIYRLRLTEGAQAVSTHFNFHGAMVALTAGEVQPHGKCDVGDMWEIVPGPFELRNVGKDSFESYVVEIVA